MNEQDLKFVGALVQGGLSYGVKYAVTNSSDNSRSQVWALTLISDTATEFIEVPAYLWKNRDVLCRYNLVLAALINEVRAIDARLICKHAR